MIVLTVALYRTRQALEQNSHPSASQQDFICPKIHENMRLCLSFLPYNGIQDSCCETDDH